MALTGPACLSGVVDLESSSSQSMTCVGLKSSSSRSLAYGASSAPLSETLAHNTKDRAKSKKTKVLKCSVPNCEHEGLFARQFELDRHISTKHSDHKPFHCGAINCFDKTLPWRFARSDKLANHIRAKHHREVLFADCPADLCDISPRTLEALAVHIQLAHPALSGEARAIVSVALGQKRKCPWWRCAKHISCDKLFAHLNDHQPEEIIAAQDSIHFEGFALADTTVTLGALAPLIQIVCPVCKAAVSNFKQFVHHVWASHLFIDASTGPYHFLEWRDTLKRLVRQTSRTSVTDLHPWTALTVDLHYSDTKLFRCPNCRFSSSAYSGNSARDHHLTLLRPQEDVVAEMYPVRFQILRLYPESATHPVFHDLA